MARPREFNTDTALAQAMTVFWEHGYSDATLPDLLEGMNLTRGSLYKAFTDKKTLFLKVLARYDTHHVGKAVALLSDPDETGWAPVLSLFETIAQAVEAGEHRGCLLCSAIAGPATYDPEIRAVAERSLDRLGQAFETALKTKVPAQMRPALAQLLVTQYVGMRILSQRQETAAVIRQNLAALKEMSHRFT